MNSPEHFEANGMRHGEPSTLVSPQPFSLAEPGIKRPSRLWERDEIRRPPSGAGGCPGVSGASFFHANPETETH